MRPRLITALGLFLFVAAVYALAGPGRIDIIDGQYRFEVTKNLVEDRSIQVRDPFLGYAVQGVIGTYSPYGISGSLVALPLVAAASIGGPPSQDSQQFFFSFTSAVLGGATVALLFLFYVELGVRQRPALWWSLAAAFGTLAFPVATSVFEQAQHGFFVLAACFAAYMSARRDSMALAVVGGACLAVLVNYQETFAVLFPALALAAIGAAERLPKRRSVERAVVFAFSGAMGILFWVALNNYRFGQLLVTGPVDVNHPPPLGNPLLGAVSLLASPGKSLFLYSPPAILGIVGLWRLRRQEPWLFRAAAAAVLTHFALISSLSFFGGDWCWGPRYFVPVLPLLALGMPVAVAWRGCRRIAAGLLVATGCCVQLLAVSVDHHRFFYARSLPTFFWYTRPTYYFEHSALFARPSEVVDMIRHGVPEEADEFRPGPYSGLLTYAVFGGWGHPGERPPTWMRHYRVFWLPRPWPLWMRTVPPGQRPVNMPLAEGALAAIAVTGLIAVVTGRGRPRETS